MESPMGIGFVTDICIAEVVLRPGDYQERPTRLLAASQP